MKFHTAKCAEADDPSRSDNSRFEVCAAKPNFASAAPQTIPPGGAKTNFQNMEQRNQLNQYSSPQSKKSRTVARAPMGWASWLAVVLMVVSTMPGCGNQAENERLAGDSPTLSPSLDNPDFAWQSFLEQGCNALLHAKDPAAAIAYFEEAESVVEAAGLDERLQDLPVLKLARRAKKEGMKGDFPMEDFYWEAARQKDLPTGYLAYLQQFPEGKFAGEARRKMGQ